MPRGHSILPRKIQSVEHRFWAKVDKGGPNGCWLWTGKKSGNGYGSFSIRDKVFYTHRYSYEMFKGPIPEKMFVLHKCDTPACLNPAHLFLGTQLENVRDMLSKGRGIKPGYKLSKPSGNIKLPKETIDQIRQLYATGQYGVMQLAQMFGYSHANISRIVHNKQRILF